MSISIFVKLQGCPNAYPHIISQYVYLVLFSRNCNSN